MCFSGVKVILHVPLLTCEALLVDSVLFSGVKVIGCNTRTVVVRVRNLPYLLALIQRCTITFCVTPGII